MRIFLWNISLKNFLCRSSYPVIIFRTFCFKFHKTCEKPQNHWGYVKNEYNYFLKGIPRRWIRNNKLFVDFTQWHLLSKGGSINPLICQYSLRNGRRRKKILWKTYTVNLFEEADILIHIDVTRVEKSQIGKDLQ